MTLEEILMDPVVQGAIITVAGTLVLAVIGGFIKIVAGTINDKKYWGRVDLKIGAAEGKSLSDQHSEIKNIVIDGNDKLINKVEHSADKLLNEVKGIDTFLKVKEEREKGRYASLSDSQKRLDSQIEGIKSIFTELNRLQIENQQYSCLLYTSDAAD
ncbi:MAG: hypothetical protein N2376_08815, partial [Clostridia bacterium]|nr:hypothetical protein [Clostridia bacterium]